MYAGDLSGAGARLYGGRWNSLGRPMVYLASTRSLAMLEVLVHLSPTTFPGDFCIAEIKVPDDSIKELSIKDLPANWQDILPPIELKKQQSLLLKVPSAIVAEEFNYLLNPLHPSISKVKLIKQLPFNFDQRLV